ncbi:hypothetical protein DXG03_007222 [Asterophora parasitica]|uniref:Trafficking protein particle complex subunit 13 middle domain-containing protein n=1 Tax=Asterophora parasitica TaxID=117018 RepID=A0A9P7KBY3_9AGAR|nr:hypothetical protein DXG03_007222 [Asterophora parasitica]
MQPQDIRQYIYILSPKSASLSPISYTPGAVIPLGRLDIFWRSSFGEPGRLLTSMLSRRIPIPAPPGQSPVSALPPYLKRTMSTTTPSRPQSPQLNMSRPGTPTPQRPSSPSQGRPSSVGIPRPQSPFQAQAALAAEIEVSLIIRETPRTARVEKPFTIPVALVLSSPLFTGQERLRRAVKLVIQHLQPPRSAVPPHPAPAPPAEAFSPRLPSSGFSTPSSSAPTFNYALAHQKLTAAAGTSPRQRALDDLERNASRSDNKAASLPPPYFSGPEELRLWSTNVTYVGSSATYLPTIELTASDQAADQMVAVHDIELTYVALQKGFATVGGLRVLLVEDRYLSEGDTADDTYRIGGSSQARILKEWDVISEVWVSP